MRNRCHIHNLYWFNASSECNLQYTIDSTTEGSLIDTFDLTYTITHGEQPVLVEILDTGFSYLHTTVPSQHVFEGIPYGSYTLKITDASGCIEYYYFGYPTSECLNGLVFEAIFLFLEDDLQYLPEGYNHPCPPTAEAEGTNLHFCNRAFFELYVNETYLGDFLMNNANGTGGAITLSGRRVCTDYYNLPTWTSSSDSRYSRIEISEAQATDIINNNGGDPWININIYGTIEKYGYICDSTRPFSHSDVTWIRISRPDGTVLFNRCVEGENALLLNICTGEVDDLQLLTSVTGVYELNETSGTTVVESHNGYDGTNFNVTINQTGKIGASYYFDGNSGTYLQLSAVFYLLPKIYKGNISLWFNASSIDSGDLSNIILTIPRNSITPAIIISLGANNQLQCYARSSYTTVTQTNLMTISTGTWYYLFVVYNGQDIFIYINNILIIQFTMITVLTATIIKIGSDLNGGNNFNGYIDQISFFERNLNSIERAALYNNGDGLPYSNWE